MAGSLASRTITVPSIVNYYTDSELNSEYHAKIEYEQAIKKYGAIYKILDLNNAGMNEAELQTFAREWIRKHYFDGVLAFTVKGIDLHLLGYNKDKLCVGDRIPVEFLDVYKTPVTKVLTCISAQYDLLNPGNSTYKIGIPDVSMDVKIPNKNRNGGVGKKSSSYSSSNSSGGAALYEYYKEIDTKAQINADEIELLANRIVANTDDLTLTSQIADINTDNLNIVSTAVAGIQESAVIQNGTEIVHVVGAFNVKDDYYGDWPLWDPTYKYKAGAKVRYGNKGYILLHDIPESVDIDINNPIYWEEQHGRKGIELIDGAAMELDNINGQRVSIGTKISSYDETIDKFEGSALWTQRDNITGVCGEYDVYTDPLTGKKTLIIKSGGGVKIRRDNTEFGIYDEDNLKGGIIVDKINTADWPEWEANHSWYMPGDKVSYHGVGYTCKIRNNDSVFDSSKWDEYVSTNTKIIGDVVEIKSRDGTYISASDAVNDHEERINGVTTKVTTFEGSDLWVERDHITGVAGEYDVYVDPVTGKKTLIITSGGGIKIRKNNAEFGLYDEDSLTGGILVDKVNTAQWMTWVANRTYHIGDKVVYNGNGYICKTEHTVPSGGTFDATKWTKYHSTNTRINGDIVEIKTTEGTYITTSEAINEHEEEIGGLTTKVTTFEGSDLWVERDHITGVAGEYDVYVDPSTGKKTLIIKSGGGIKIRKNNTEFGLYDEDSLTGGILVDKVNTSGWGAWVSGAEYPVGAKVTHNGDGWICKTAHRSGDTFDSSKWTKYHATNTKIIGDVVDIEARQIRAGNTTNVEDWLEQNGQDIDDLEGLVADKITVYDAKISNIESNYLTVNKLASLADVTVQYLHSTNIHTTFNVDAGDFRLLGADSQGHETTTSIKSSIKAIQIIPDSNHANQYILQYKNWYDKDTDEWRDASTFEHAVTVTGNWNGESSTVPVPYYEVLGSSNELKTYVYLEIEPGGYSVSPNTKINAKIYHDSTASTNQLITKELTLEENVNGKYVELYTGSKQASPPTNMQKGYISTTNTYNSGWNSARSYVVDNLPTASIGSNIDSTYNKISIKYPGTNGSSTLSNQDYTLNLNSSFKPSGSTTAINAVELKTGSTVVARISGQSIYTTGYRAGSQAVGWDTSWSNDVPYTDANHNKLTVATTGRVNSSGNADNHTGSWDIYVTSDNNVAYARLASASGVIIAQTTHNKYNTGWNSARSYVVDNLPTTSIGSNIDSTYNKISIKYPGTNGSSTLSNQDYTLNLNSSFKPSGSTTAINAVELKTGSTVVARISGQSIYTTGYRAGSQAVGWDTSWSNDVPYTDANHNKLTVATTGRVNSSGNADNHTGSWDIYVTSGNNVAYARLASASGTIIAQTTHNKYNTGWNNARSYVVDNLPTTSIGSNIDSTYNKISIKYPGTNGSSTLSNQDYTLNLNSSFKPSGSTTAINAVELKTGSTVVARISGQSIYTTGYRAGSQAVGWSTSWSSGTPYTDGNHNKLTVATTGRVDGSGNADNHTGSWDIYVTSGNNVAYARLASASGTIIAQVSHNKYTTGYRAGSQDVGWSTSWSSGTPYTDGNHNKLTVATTGRVDSSGNADNHTGAWDVYVTSDNNVAYARLASASGTIIAQTTHNKYNTGWNNARSYVVDNLPTTSIGSNIDSTYNKISIKYPGTNGSSTLSDKDYTLSLNSSFKPSGSTTAINAVELKTGSTVVARISGQSIYTTGYRAGSQAVGWSTSWSSGTPYTDGNHNKLTVATTGRVDSSGNADDHTGSWDVYVTSTNNVAYARLGSASGTVIAQVSHNKYTTGYRAGSQAVGWSTSWSNGTPYTDGNHNKLTVATTGRVDDSGAADNHSGAWDVYVTSDNNVAYARLASASGTIIAQTTHNKYTAGQTAAGVELDATNHKIKRALSSSTKEYTVSMYTGNTWANGKRTIEARVGSTAINSAEITAPSATITFDCTDLGDPSRTASGQNDNPITATAKHGTYSLGTGTQVIHMTEGNWNGGYKAVNCRLTDSSGKLLDRLWIEAPVPSVSTKTSSSGTYKGTFSRPAAGSYLTISCGGNTYSWLVQ